MRIVRLSLAVPNPDGGLPNSLEGPKKGAVSGLPVIQAQRANEYKQTMILWRDATALRWVERVEFNWTSHRLVQAGTASFAMGLLIEEYAAVESLELISSIAAAAESGRPNKYPCP